MENGNSTENIIVVKIGGSTLGNEDTSLEDIAELAHRGFKVVVVHGGGASISEWLGRIGLPARFSRGLRVTDRQTMEVVTMVLAGKVNKELVARLSTLGVRAVGLSGADAAILKGHPLDPELGLVGEVTQVDPEVLRILVSSGYVPVVAPIAVSEDGDLLNVNADTAAAELAVALKAHKAVFLTDVAGVKGADGTLLPLLTPEEVKVLIDNGVITGGMIPKVEACLRAAEAASSVHIMNAGTLRALSDAVLSGKCSGTTIAASRAQ